MGNGNEAREDNLKEPKTYPDSLKGFAGEIWNNKLIKIGVYTGGAVALIFLSGIILKISAQTITHFKDLKKALKS